MEQAYHHHRRLGRHHERASTSPRLRGIHGVHAAEALAAAGRGGEAVGRQQRKREKLCAAAWAGHGHVHAPELGGNAVQIALAPVKHPHRFEVHGAEGSPDLRFGFVGDAALDEADVHGVIGLEAAGFDGAGGWAQLDLDAILGQLVAVAFAEIWWAPPGRRCS